MTDTRIPTEHRPRVWLEDGLCRIEFSAGVTINREMVEYVFRRRLLLMQQAGERHKLLVTTAGRVAGMDYDASRLSVSLRISETVAACAVVTASPAMRMIVAPFVLMYRPKYPIRLFPDEATARGWLATIPGAAVPPARTTPESIHGQTESLVDEDRT
ncbi:MAG: hypothetical protein ACOY33_06735 [Pseudomonadota bacterium]